jgi:GT2 family glycosyltransferase
MSPTPDISVVMVTWNSAEYLPASLAALDAQQGVRWELIAVDNASQDGTLALLPPHTTAIRNHTNRGFAPAANQGIARARGPYVLLLNPDATLDPGYLAALRDALQADPAAASATGTLYADRARTVLDSTGHIPIRGGITWNRDAEAPERTNEVFGVSAAAALYRRAALQDVAGPDGILAESFFAYYEDVDLDWRLRWRGWRALHVPAATGVHRRSASGARRSAFLRRRQMANDLLLLVHVYPREWLLAQAPELLRLWAGTLLGTALRHPGDLAGLLLALRGLPRALRVRRRTMRTRRVEPRELERWLRPRPWPWFGVKNEHPERLS